MSDPQSLLAQELAHHGDRVQALEREVAQARQDLARRDEQAKILEASRADLQRRLGESERRLAEIQGRSRGFQDRLQRTEDALEALEQEVQRLGTALAEGRGGPIHRLIGWIRKANHARLARRRARRASSGEASHSGHVQPSTTPAVGHGPIAWIRRKNRARLARRKARKQAALDSVARTVPSDVIALGLIPVEHDRAWSAYPRLKEEFRRLRATRHTTFEATPCDLVRAPDDLAAFARGLSLPAPAAPRVSIIVPVFNHLRETLECIASVAAHTPAGDYEIIVVDDGSSDQTAAILPQITQLRFFRNATNGGFIVSCSRGAQEARGEFLVFLNNDAQVTAGWLPPLLETFSKHDRVGAVGPKILYPDGRLQEAGAMINPDLSVTMVGLDDDPRKARYSYAREVHYCSGACLVVPRRRFEEVGGFARDLEPAYYEDCDLQLKLRSLGLRTIYQPASVVVHHLSRTSEGLPDPAGFKMGQIARNSQRMRERWGDVVDAMHAVRLIAFYLPQFHPFPENELWWGKGFTEWTNVAKAQPCFAGHEQPHLPTDLGFYDLRVPDVMQEQARVARAYGISGFCYYYYWFNGKRLLEEPIERLLSESPAAMPFCLCWANENWTRRWDGGEGESEILMGQSHSDDDDEAVIRDLIRYLRHPSYIRVQGKPMLLVYRVSLFPDVWRTAATWRDICLREGIGEIHLVRVDSFENSTRSTPPSVHGFDAAVEFPPHNSHTPLSPSPRFLRPGFSGMVHDYERMASRKGTYKDAGYLHYRTVIPRWDNTPRRQDAATIYAHSSPGAYQAYLEEVLRYTREQNVGDDRILFVNAWNEWAEGAHLEPDRRYGRTYLEATRNALAAHLVDRGA